MGSEADSNADTPERIGTDPTRPGGLQRTLVGRPVAVDGPPEMPSSTTDLDALPEIDPTLYVTGHEIGKGGMGRILAARDRKLRRDVVIKVLRNGAYGVRFEREALITARLQHPSIVRVYDAGKLEGEPFYAMEHVRGKTLDRVVAEAEDADARLRLLPRVIAVADALAYAHSEGVIHRDLKPANILVGEFGETVVIDWGLAKDLRRQWEDDSIDPDRKVPGPREEVPKALAGDLTVAGAVMGTPSHMPPEQARGERADERSDVYSIGAILYTVLSGTPPVSGERALEDAKAGGITPLRERAPETPDELVTIVEHAMAFDPADRYTTARELADDLRRFAAGKLVARHAYTRGALIKRWVKRYRAPIAVAAVLLGVLGGAAFVTFRKLTSERDEATRSAVVATEAMQLAEDNNDRLVLFQAERSILLDPSRAVAWLKRLSPRGLERPRAREIATQAAARGIAYELSGPADDVERVVTTNAATAYSTSKDGQIWRWHLTGFTGDKLGEHPGPITSLATSPDGFWLATAGNDRLVRLWDLEQVQVRSLKGHVDTVRIVAFSPDGNSLASADASGAVWLWSVADGKGKEVFRTQPTSELVWNVDGKRLWIGTAGGLVVDFDVATGKHTQQRVHSEVVSVIAPSLDGKRVASGGLDGKVFAWTIGGKPEEIGKHGDAVYDLAWTNDARLVSAGASNEVYVHEFLTNTRGKLFLPGVVHDVAIGTESRFAMACADGRVYVWTLALEQLHVLKAHEGAANAVAFTPDGSKLVSGGNDNAVRLWPLARPAPPPTGSELATWLAAQTNLSVLPSPRP